ncbi:MAG: hypothetical protein SFX72_21210 [Isosphaeraceae bacterium]|nr:hypothetical protein [Isosphaeraceae bacterium]
MNRSSTSADLDLDAIRDRDDWTDLERDAAFERLVARYTPAELIVAARARIGRLDGRDADAVLRILQAFGSRDDFDDLARALETQPNLGADRLWECLGLLDFAGALDDHPELVALAEELEESLDEEGSFRILLEQIGSSDEEMCLALQGLHVIEPAIRREILLGLVGAGSSPRLAEFLRLLTFAVEPTTRSSAIEALALLDAADPKVAACWRSIAEEHSDPTTRSRAIAMVEGRSTESSGALAVADRGSASRSAVSAIDGAGLATIVLARREEATGLWDAAAFLCDVIDGVREVEGLLGVDSRRVDSFIREHAATEPEAGSTEAAVALLGGILGITGAGSPPVLRFWVERAAGSALRISTADGRDRFGDWDPAHVPFASMPERVEAVLDACPGWIDDSEATRAIASEFAARTPVVMPDPERDAGAYRYLFEHHLASRLERHRRMLYWMAVVWSTQGRLDLARSAHALAWQLADPQHAVPSHPFPQALTTRSLNAAIAQLSASNADA